MLLDTNPPLPGVLFLFPPSWGCWGGRHYMLYPRGDVKKKGGTIYRYLVNPRFSRQKALSLRWEYRPHICSSGTCGLGSTSRRRLKIGGYLGKARNCISDILCIRCREGCPMKLPLLASCLLQSSTKHRDRVGKTDCAIREVPCQHRHHTHNQV
jgi:hypothetical protein